MPGKNCAIPGCPACKSRHKGLSFFRIRRPDDEEWEKALIKAVNRCDRSFNVENATICSRHFKPECYKEGKGTGRSLIRGSLPTEFMPKKSVETPKPPCRKPPFQRTAPDLAERVKYYNLEDVQKEVADGLPAPWCVLSTSCERIVLASVGEDFQIRLKLHITPDFAAVVSVFDFSAHELTTNIEKVGLKVHLHKLSTLQVCSGITDSLLQDFSELPGVDNQQPYFRHIQYSTDELGNIKHASSVRSKSCQLLLESPLVVCKHCRYAQTLLQRKLKRVEESNSKPVSVNNSLNCLTKEKLTKEYKTLRKENKRLQKEFKRSLETESIEVNPALHNSLKTVLDENVIQDPIQKLFWQEQSKAFRTGPQGMRWHPMMLRLAILLHSKSPAAYETLRNTGVLRLPGESTLRDYTNEYHPKPGFQKRALDDLRKTSETLGEHERFVVLLHDEMAIKSDLVFDKRSGEIVGFVNTQEQEPTGLATHALVFYVVGLSTTISTSIGFFGTQSVTADTLFRVFWQAVGHVEGCGLKVIASTSDKASPNQRLYDIHGGDTQSICYKARNMFAPEREIFFFSDVPHLIKTVRNNIYNSGSGKRTRYLWLNGQHLLWKHIVDVFNTDLGGQLRRTKLTSDHVYLTPASIMNVRLAAQVLSCRVGKIMMEYSGQDCQETAKFIMNMDRFFDCLNVRSLSEGIEKRKPDLLPYKSLDDERFTFLEEFYYFLIQWKQAVATRSGNFTQAERAKMFLSHQTFKGLCMTLKAFPEVTKYLLKNGVQFVLSNKFCQDPLEAHFGRQRGLGRRNDNPNLWMFGYNDNKLRLARSLAISLQPKGNVKRTNDQEQTIITTSPLKKIKRH